jgi:hypothetical protein
MHANQIVADMADEVLARQARARAQLTGESFEDAHDAVLSTEAGRQLQELHDGPHRHERADKWQASIAQQRIEERVEEAHSAFASRSLLAGLELLTAETKRGPEPPKDPAQRAGC